MYPAGAQAGQSATGQATGFNLGGVFDKISAQSVSLNTAGSGGAASVFLNNAPAGPVSNSLPILLTGLPTYTEKEPNDSRASATPIAIPCLVNGQFWRETARNGRSGAGGNIPDVDVFKFTGVAGQRVVIDVICQKLGSPADPIVTLLGPDDKPLAENDDTNGRDSHLDMVLPTGGEYAVRVAEARGAQQSRARLLPDHTNAPAGFRPCCGNAGTGGRAGKRRAA